MFLSFFYINRDLNDIMLCMSNKKWVVVAKGADYNKIARDFGISPYLARIISVSYEYTEADDLNV